MTNGDLRLKVEERFGSPLETHNSFIALTDAICAAIHEHLSESTLERLQIQAGRPLYLDRFSRAGSEAESRYVVGERSGLTLVSFL